jgi:hypothetical protein
MGSSHELNDLFVPSLACRTVRAAEEANELKEREVKALEKLAKCVVFYETPEVTLNGEKSGGEQRAYFEVSTE